MAWRSLINNLIIKLTGGGCKSAERAPLPLPLPPSSSYDPGRSAICGAGEGGGETRSGVEASGRSGRKEGGGRQGGKEEEDKEKPLLFRWMVGTMVMVVMMLPPRA